MAIELSIILVNWNSLRYLRDCLKSVFEQTQGICFEVIIVDNNSPELGVEALEGEFPGVCVVLSKENLGFAGANNLGFKRSTGRHLLFLNPDTQLISPVLPLILRRLEELPDAGVVGCKLLNSDLTVQTSCIQTFPTILNQLLDIESVRVRWPGCSLWNLAPLYSSSQTPSIVEVISGACMMMKREVFERAGMFSEEYFMYAEDLDLCYKVMRLGLKNYYVGEAAVIHHGGKSSSQSTVSQWSTFMKLRAIHKFCIKTRGSVYAFLYRAAIGSAAALRLTLIAAMRLLGLDTVKNFSLRAASKKWLSVLQWALGLSTSAVQNR